MDVIPTAMDELASRHRSIDSAWRAHGPTALRLATVLVGPSDAHDITVTAFLRVIDQPNWVGLERLDLYLLRAVRNEAHNLRRQRHRRWQRDLTAVRPTSMTDPTHDLDLWRAVAALSVRQRAVVFLAYWQDMTVAQIAETLDASPGSVQRTLSRARISLRKALT